MILLKRGKVEQEREANKFENNWFWQEAQLQRSDYGVILLHCGHYHETFTT